MEKEPENLPAQEEKKDDYVMPLPKEEKADLEAAKEVNKKPFWTMRVAGGLIDMLLMLAATIGLFYLIRISPMGNVLTNYQNDMVLIQENYKLQELLPGSGETYGHKVYENEAEYENYKKNHIYDADESGYKYVIVNNDEISDEMKTAYSNAIKNDKTYSDISFNYRLVEYGYTMLAGFVSMSVFILLIPLLNKRRASLGKLAAGTSLINSKYEVPAKWYQVVGRFLFSFLVEGALPYLFISGWTMLAVPVLLFIISLINKQGRTLHDLISRTKVIDKKTFVPLSEQ